MCRKTSGQKAVGLRELADLSDSGSRYAIGGLLAKRSFPLKITSAMVRFIEDVWWSRFIISRRGRKRAWKSLKRYTRIDAPDHRQASLRLCIPSCFQSVPEIFPEDLKLMFEEVALTNPKVKAANPASFIDGRAVPKRCSLPAS